MKDKNIFRFCLNDTNGPWKTKSIYQLSAENGKISSEICWSQLTPIDHKKRTWNCCLFQSLLLFWGFYWIRIVTIIIKNRCFLDRRFVTPKFLSPELFFSNGLVSVSSTWFSDLWFNFFNCTMSLKEPYGDYMEIYQIGWWTYQNLFTFTIAK